jgi:rhomboid protease GluP
MELNPILLLMVGFSIGITLWRAIFVLSTRYLRGVIVACVLVLALMVFLLIVRPEQAGVISAVAWLIFLVIPAQGRRAIELLSARGRYPQAIRLAKIIRILHPADGYWEFPEILRAFDLEIKGDIEGSIAILQKYESQSIMDFHATTRIMRLQFRYKDLLAWLENPDNITPMEMKRDPGVVESYLAALGQNGQIGRMIQEFQRLRPTLERSQGFLGLSYLRLFAHTGQRQPVDQLLSGIFYYLPPPAKKSWLALAELAAGKSEVGNTLLHELLESNTEDAIKRLATYYLQHPPPAANTILAEADLAVLQSIKQEFEHFHAYERGAAVLNNRRPYATWVIIILNLIMFVLEMQQGGSENLQTLYQLGALWPPAVLISGEWWRVLTAMFLHLGLAHIALNMLALYVLGPFLERMLGVRRYVLIYALSGLGSMVTILALTQAGLLQPNLLVGASGAILGLVGATAAIYLRDWRLRHSQLARSRLLRPLFIVVTQFMVDLIIPQTSLVGHLSGAVWGFITALLVIRFTRQKSPPHARQAE